MVENSARFVAIFGGALASVFFAYAGSLWITSGGDPQRVAQARTGVIGVAVGLVIVGLSVFLPSAISDVVIEPSGGAGVRFSGSGQDCDRLLRRHLEATPAASVAAQVNAVVDAVQARFEACRVEQWDPEAVDVTTAGKPGLRPPSNADCGSEKPVEMGGVPVPATLHLRRAGLGPNTELVHEETMRDPFGNRVIWWNRDSPPSDSASCWVYFQEFKSWQVDYNG